MVTVTKAERTDALEHLLHVKTLLGSLEPWEIESNSEFQKAAWDVVQTSRGLYKFLEWEGIDEEDGKQEMDIHMFHLCCSWNPDLGKWSTYVVASLRWHMMGYKKQIAVETYSPASLPVNLRSMADLRRALSTVAEDLADRDTQQSARIVHEQPDLTRFGSRVKNLVKAQNALESKRIDWFRLVSGEAGEQYKYGELDASIVGTDEQDLIDSAAAQEIRAGVQEALKTLDDRSRLIVMERFGSNGEQAPQTLNEVASKVGVTRERVRQIEVRSLQKLRTSIWHLRPLLE